MKVELFFNFPAFSIFFLISRVFIKPYNQVTVFKEEQDWDPTSKMKLTTSVFDNCFFFNLRFYVCLSFTKSFDPSVFHTKLLSPRRHKSLGIDSLSTRKFI